MAGVRFEDVDLLGALSRIVDLHTQHYKEDFDLDIYWRFLPRHNRSAAQKNPVNKVCLLFAFSVPTECAAIATGNDFRGLGICHQQAFSRNSGNGISAKYAILRKIALLADLLTPCIFNEDVVVYIVVSCG